ncbi:MAG TPA: hypothetical protein PLE16_11180 [Spirochaetota bacterium]|nr:hypothetical protein [Spirochaetota bacterium]HOH37415.1 hypothetical protein [Spirochaetota bacterium]HPM35144.1 hypothetical protein [Spirochaetota bacterium]HPW51832.1 hypothetical protein [Spirochaetota bacterium]HPY03471.1 hypothetical protein [Spirochaetota bacterium]
MKSVKLIIMLLTFTISANSQDFSIPEPMDLFKYSVPEGTEYGYSKPYNYIYGFPTVRIWGWSKKGKLAYSIERSIEGKGGYLIEYAIFDLSKKKIVWKIEDDSNNFDDYAEDDKFSEFSYKIRKQKLLNAFKKNGIVMNKNTFLKLPIQHNNKTYDFNLNIKNEKKPEFHDSISEYSVVVKNGNKTKIIKKETKVKALSVFLCGYFKSPYENKAVIVTAEEQFVFEGTELFYSFTGFDLK